MAKAIHAMIRVLEEQRAVGFYDKAFGLKPSSRLDFPTFTLIYLRNAQADFEIELTVNKDRKEPYTHGDGYGHIAFVVDDLAAEHARFLELGLNPLDIKEFLLRASSSRASSSSRTPTATRSRFCSVTDTTSQASPAS